LLLQPIEKKERRTRCFLSNVSRDERKEKKNGKAEELNARNEKVENVVISYDM
jgi:hypothetical protein